MTESHRQPARPRRCASAPRWLVLAAIGRRARRRWASPRCSRTSSSGSRRREPRSTASSRWTTPPTIPRSGGRTSRSSTTTTARRSTRCARATAAARASRTRRRSADPRSVVAQSRLQEDPRLRELWAGYAFAQDFREERGHAYMLEDQEFTERQQVTKQPGTCLHCHASLYVPYQRAGNGDLIKGFETLNPMPYFEARKHVQASRVVHRLPRPGHDAAPRDASRLHRRHPAAQGEPGHRRTTT